MDTPAGDEAIRSWDPLLEAAARQMSLDMPMPPGVRHPIRLGIARASLAVRARPGAHGLGLLAVVLAAGALVCALRPGAFFGGSSDLADTMAGIAAATAFSALVVGAMAVPATTSIELGPGYTTDVTMRRGPWLLASAQVALMVVLFVLAAHAPTGKTVTVSALGAGSLFAASWLVGFQQIAGGDRLQVAQREARRKRAACRLAIERVRRMRLLTFPRKHREALADHPVVRADELQVLAGFLSHLRSGVTSTLAARQPALAYEFITTQVDCFQDYAKARDGRVGGNTPALDVLVDTVRTLVVHALKEGPEADQAAVAALKRLDDLIAAPFTDMEYGPVRSRLITLLGDVTQWAWANDTTALASQSVERLGAAARRLAAIRGAQDASRILEIVGGAAGKARDSRRTHISLACAQQLAVFFPSIAQAHGGVGTARNLLPAWAGAVQEVVRDWPAGPARLPDVHGFFIGGVTLSGRGIQDQWWVPWKPELVPDLLDALGAVIRPAAERLRESKDQGRFHLKELLALVYGLSHRLAPGPDAGGAAADWAAKLKELLECVAAPYGKDVVRDPELAQLVWSTAVSVAYLGRDIELVGGALSWLPNDLDSGEWDPDVASSLGRWARLLAGEDRALVDRWVASVRAADPYGGFVGLVREREGTAPALNLNMIAVHHGLAAAIESWADEALDGVLARHATTRDDGAGPNEGAQDPGDSEG